MFRLLPALILGAMSMVPVHALLFQGTVKESRFGMGIDSVKVSLNGSASVVHTDSNGHFSFTTVALHGRSAARPEVLWLAASRAIAWSSVTGPVSISISDAGGRIVLSHVSEGTAPAGVFTVAGLEAGIYFIRVLAMGNAVSWIWYAIPGKGSGRDLPGSLDAAYPLGGRTALRKGAAEISAAADTLVFEKNGFIFSKRAVAGSESGMEIGLTRNPIRILIVDGMSNHDWRQTTKVARAVFAKAGFFSVDVSTAPAGPDTAAWKAWRPVFKDYETVVMNYNSGHTNGSLRWPRQKEMELEEFVKAGGGLYALHSANNSFPEWGEYNKMIATGWRDANFGSALQVDSLGGILRIAPGTGGGTGHGARADVPVQLLARHPIHKGYPRTFLTSSLEIYQYARGPALDCEVLSYAFDGAVSGNSKKNWPVELMIAYGKGRVYNSTMGHVWSGETMPDAIRDVAFQTAFIRAAEWLARREVLYPLPAIFNTASKVVYEDLILP